MPAPLAKGIIMAASIVVAAGIAIYESPQVRAWVDQSRRKIAVALHNLGDDIHPRRPSESSSDSEARASRRDELVRRNRNELIRRAREEGVAVDLDELARIGTETADMAERRSRADRARSSDGMLKQTTTTATGSDVAGSGPRNRGAVALAAGACGANPFGDEHVLFVVDEDEDDAPAPKPFTYAEPMSRESCSTIDFSSGPTAAAPPPRTEDDQAAQSFYSFASSASHTQDHDSHAPFVAQDAHPLSNGTLTPRSERSHSIATGADDSDILRMQNDSDHDAPSEVFSDAGFTDAGLSEAGFSELDRDDRTGVMTPNSWTDVGSDDESEWGGANAHAHVSQIHQ